MMLLQMTPAGVVGSHNAPHNSAPVFSAIPDASTPENVFLSVAFTASDPDGDDLVFELTGAPSGSYFYQDTATSAVFEWTPTYDQAGDYNMTMRVYDEYEGIIQPFNVSVTNVNRAPTMALIPNSFIEEFEHINKQWTSVDPDGDLVTLTLESDVKDVADLPAGVSYHDHGGGNAGLAWTPDCTQGALPYPGEPYHFWANATDGSATTSREFDIFVLDVNTAPSIIPVLHHKADEGDFLTFDIEATSCEAGEELFAEIGLVSAVTSGISPPPLPAPWPNMDLPVGASVAPEMPDAMLFDAVSGNNYTTFSWLVGDQQVGNYTFYAYVEDASGLSDNITFTVFINATNTPPMIILPAFHDAAQELYYAKEDTRFFATLPLNGPLDIWTATAFDLEDDIVDWELFHNGAVEDLPEGMTVTRSEHLPASASFLTIEWVPTYEQAGNYSFELQLSDGVEIDSRTFNISVENTNRVPAIDAIPNYVVFEGEELRFDFYGTDLDFQDPTFPDDLELTADDGFGGPIPPGSDFQDPHEEQFTTFEGEFKWTPSYSQAGTYLVRFTADDSDLDVVDPANPLTSPLVAPPPANPVELTTITVLNVDRAPTVQVPCAPMTVMYGTSIAMPVAFNDLDMDLISIYASYFTPLPAFLAVTDNGDGTGSLDGTPAIGDIGSYTVVINATSGPASLTVQTTCVLTVVGDADFSLDVIGSNVVLSSPGAPETVSVLVTNHLLLGGDTISFSVDMGTEGAVATTPAPVVLGPGGAAIVTMDITVPAGEPDFVVKLRGVSAINPEYFSTGTSIKEGTQAGFIVRVPVITSTVMTNTLPVPSITGLVTATYLNGAPAVGHAIDVTQAPWYDIIGVMETTTSGTTDAGGLFAFDFGQLDLFAGLPDEHDLTTVVDDFGWLGPESGSYVVGP